MDPNDWQRYNKRRPQSRSGGMDLGIGGGSGSGNLGIADYLTANFDNLGGGSLTPQQELAATQKAIREGGAMKAPETDVTRFITQAPDGSNYMDPKPAEIPPMLARQITDPTPPAPASGSGINPQMLVRPQGDAQSRGSNLANTMPRREDFRRREMLAKQMEDDAIKLQGNGFAKFWGGDLVTDSIAKKMAVAQQLRQGDDADYQASVRQYYIQNPDKFAEWQRSEQIRQGKLEQFAAANFVDGAGNVVQGGQFGGIRTLPGVNTQGMRENAQVDARMAADDARKAEAERLARESKAKGWGVEKDIASMKVGADMAQVGLQRDKLNTQLKVAKARRMNEKELRAAEAAGGRAGTPKFDLAAAAMGFTPVPVGDPPRIEYVLREDLEEKPTQTGAAAPATGAKGAAPATSKYAITKR